MNQVASWFKAAVTTLLDPDRESRVQVLVSAIHHGLHTQGQRFSLEQAIASCDHSEKDVREAKERVYRGVLERGWSDGVLTGTEQKTAKWLAAKLAIPSEQARNLDFEQARKSFGVTLAKAMQDGVVDSQEEDRLNAIAGAVGCTLPEFARTFFQREGEAFLRSIFLSCVADNRISQSEWDYLLYVTQRFGLQPHEMLATVEPQARQFVEHVLADAKSDGKLSADESKTLHWLVQNLQLPDAFLSYVVNEARLLQMLTSIEEGRLPSVLMPPGMEHRAGEITHWVGPVTWREHRSRKDGVHVIDHTGVLALTDNRLIFSSGMKSQTIGYRRIVRHAGSDTCLHVQTEGKPLSQYYLADPTPVAYAILRTAVAMANQTKLASLPSNSRHISREVRQRIWQRYGGRCAECSATTYLEFDHIIPVAKGGSNTDSNVQLLCRMCNLKKSDHI